MHIGGALSRQRAGVRTMHLAEILARHGARDERRPAPFPKPRARALADTQLRHNLAPRHAHDPRQARAGRRRARRLGAAARGRPRGSRTRVLRHLDEHLVELERSGHRAPGGIVHWARDAEEANAIVGRHRRAARRDRGRQVEVADDRGDELNEALARSAASAPGRPTSRELIIQLADDTPSHILVPAIHRNRDEIRELFRAHARRRTGRSDRRPARARRGRAAPSARAVPGAPASAISGANFAVAETGTVASSSPRATARMCTTLPEVLITVMGIEKVIPRLAGPRGLPAAAAALLDRRADEPVHVAVDRRDARRRPAGVPPRAARQRAHQRARRRGRARRR